MVYRVQRLEHVLNEKFQLVSETERKNQNQNVWTV